MTGPPRAERPAARILLVNADRRVLLFRFLVDGRAPFWVTPGGALDPGESYTAAAARELQEETGLTCDCGDVVARRQVEFVTLDNVPVAADERYFLVRAGECAIDVGGHTELERLVMREWRWFERDELDAWPEDIFPEDLRAMLDEVDPR